MTKGTAYGVGSGPYVKVFPAPTVSRRDPLPTDHLDIGQTWVNTVTNGVWVLTSITNGQATWTTSPAAGAGVFTDLTATGTIDLTSAVTSTYHVTGAGQNVDIASILGSVPILAGEAVGNAISLTAQNGGIDIEAFSTFSVASESFDIDATDASTITVTGGAGDDLTLSGAGGSVNIVSSEPIANSIFLHATTGGIRVDTATTLDLNLTTGFTLDAASLSLDATLASNFTVTGAGENLTLNSVGGSVVISGSEAVNNAVSIQASDVAGGVFIDSGTGGTLINSNGVVSLSSTDAIFLSSAFSDPAAIFLQSSDPASGIRLDTGTNGVSIDATGASYFTVTGVTQDLTLSSVGGSVIITADQAASDAISFDASNIAGGIEMIAGTGGIALAAAAGEVSVSAGLSADNAIRLNADGLNGGIDIDSLLGGITMDTTAAISLGAVATSDFTVTGAAADLTLSSVGGSVNVLATQAAVDAVRIFASNANGGIDIDSLLGGITVDTSAAISIDSVATSNFTVTGAAADLTLSSVGGSVNVLASQAAADAVRIFASNAAGGIDVDCGTGNFTLDSTGSFSIDGATASNVTVTGAGIDLTLESVGGSVSILANENTVGAITIAADGGAMETVIIEATQGTAIGAIDIVADVGGISMTTAALAATTGVRLIQGAASAAIQVGAGVPVHNAVKGSLYLRTDGTTTNDRAYINTNGTNGWTSLTTAA